MFEIMINGENVSVFQALLLAFLGLRGFGLGGASNNNNNNNNNNNSNNNKNNNNNNNNMRRKKRSSDLPDFLIESVIKFLSNYYIGNK